MPDATCHNCGRSLAPGARFCTACGVVVAAAEDHPARAQGDQPAARADQPTVGDPPAKRRGSRRGARLARILGACALLGGVSGAAAVYLLLGDEEPTRIVLEPVSFSTPDAFVANLDADPRAARIAAARARNAPRTFNVIDDPRAPRQVSALSGQVARGSAPGLYGGSRDKRACKVERLIDFLTADANADKATEFARVLGIDPAEIPEYVRTLTAARLSFDTRVTNHGFANGRATPSQSLLQAGTAVLVDRSGVPKVKCNCGNPLREPAQLEPDEKADETLDVDQIADNADDAWAGLDPADAVTVRPAREHSDAITLVDLETPDGLLERPVGSDGASERDTGTGDVKVKLEWYSDADLDLHVVEPAGPEIWYSAKGPTATGGQLDVDSNVGCNENGSVENVFWPLGEAPSGDYEVKVVGFTVDGCGGGDYKLTIDVAGQDPQIYEGSVTEDEEATYSFSSGR